MPTTGRERARSFSLVEMLAVVLVLAVLAAIAIPLYANVRRTSAARACRANIAAISAAESSRALRTQSYATLTSLAGGPEGLLGPPTCPLDGDAYEIVQSGTNTAIADGYTGAITIRCNSA